MRACVFVCVRAAVYQKAEAVVAICLSSSHTVPCDSAERRSKVRSFRSAVGLFLAKGHITTAATSTAVSRSSHQNPTNKDRNMIHTHSSVWRFRKHAYHHSRLQFNTKLSPEHSSAQNPEAELIISLICALGERWKTFQGKSTAKRLRVEL